VRNLKLTIAYDGTEYHGWQRQPGLRTVEGELAAVLSPITQTRVVFAAAGRTDAGVHARGQVVNFHTASTVDPERLRRAANSRLPDDILVRHIEEAGECFNARFQAVAKHYRYALWADDDKPPPEETRFVHHWYRPLEVQPMIEAARHLVGTHDFKSFETTGSQPRPTTVCVLSRVAVERIGPRIHVDVVGDRFLYNMVRNIVGTLLEVGRGHWRADDLPRILEARDRSAAGPTAPPAGLMLMEVFYGEHRGSPGSAGEECPEP
jgi:tRNA pseudouridine38-40 synthase